VPDNHGSRKSRMSKSMLSKLLQHERYVLGHGMHEATSFLTRDSCFHAYIRQSGLRKC
jgi:hypothetical protein